MSAAVADIVPESARNFSLVGYSDLDGRGHSDQIMVGKGYAYIGHSKTRGTSVVDVHDPRNPRVAGLLPHHANSWAIHLQHHGELLLVAEALDYRGVMPDQEYYLKTIGGIDSSRFGSRGVDYSAGMRVYDTSDPASPREIGFMEVAGLGIHRLWWAGGRYAYGSALLDGFVDHVLIVIDLGDPTRPEIVGRWWLPGMWVAGGETNTMKGRVGLHHAVVEGNVAYGCWRDGGLTLIDVADKANPGLISHVNWSPPYAGGTHSALPLVDRDLLVVADEAVLNIDQEPLKPIWMLDIREPTNPVTIATFPVPGERDYAAKGGHFGPHNLHENRPGTFQSSTTVFATYQSAGVRAYDIRNPSRPEEIGWFVPPTPSRWKEPLRGRAKVLHTSDVLVSRDGLAYVTDYDAGLYILQWQG
jgi:hypothetical protein